MTSMMTMKAVVAVLFISLIAHSLGYVYSLYLQVEDFDCSRESNMEQLLQKTHEQFELIGKTCE